MGAFASATNDILIWCDCNDCFEARATKFFCGLAGTFSIGWNDLGEMVSSSILQDYLEISLGLIQPSLFGRMNHVAGLDVDSHSSSIISPHQWWRKRGFFLLKKRSKAEERAISLRYFETCFYKEKYPAISDIRADSYRLGRITIGQDGLSPFLLDEKVDGRWQISTSDYGSDY